MGSNRVPLVSVVMPVHNAAPYVREAVESVLAQTLEDFELVIIDDGSTDGSGEIADELKAADSRIEVFHQANVGLAAALNNGIGAASGRYIARLDSDDVSLPDRFEKQIAFMERHQEIGVCGTRCSFFGDQGEYVGEPPATDPEEIECRLLFLPTMAHTSVMMRREILLKEGLFYSTDVGLAEDYDLWVRFSRHCALANLPDILTRIRTHAASSTRTAGQGSKRCLSTVHRKVLPSLGVDPSQEDLDLHYAISTCAIPDSRGFIDRVETWLTRLLRANETSGFCDQSVLARVLFDWWHVVCTWNHRDYLWKWRRFRGSALYIRDHPLSSPGIFARLYASRTLECSPAGRAIKRTIRPLLVGVRVGAGRLRAPRSP